jgi:hypothetical protein
MGHFRKAGEGPMSRSALMWVKAFIVLLFLGLSAGVLSAGLVGDYDESRWTIKTYGGDGTVDWLGDTCLIESGYSGLGTVAQLDVVIRASRSGTFYFNWIFYGGTTTGYRLARVRNELTTTLASRRDYAEGSGEFSALAGDLIGFRISAPLDEFPAMAEIFGFFAPGQEPAIVVQPVGTSACYGDIAIFSVVATNASDYQWQFKGQNIAEENFEDLVLRALPPADAGNYRVIVRNPLGTITSQAVPLIIHSPPTFTSTLPSTLTNCGGETITLTIGATGTSLAYQWHQNGAPLPGANSPSLILPGLTFAHAGEYRVAVSNRCGVLLSSPLVLNVIAPPLILGQPASQTRYPGESASFAAWLASSGPFSYQWRRNGLDLPGATAAFLALTDLRPEDGGLYSVVVENACGTAISSNAMLRIAAEAVGIRIVREAGATVAIEVQGAIGRQYVLEVSTDTQAWSALQTNWLVISGSPLFHDVADRNLRFYRVRPTDY